MFDHLGGLSGGVPQDDAKRKKDKKLAYIAIGLGIVGVIIAWLTLRNSGTGGGVATTSATGTDGAGSVAGYTTDGSDASYFQAILQALSGIQSTITPPAAASGTQAGAGAGGVTPAPVGLPVTLQQTKQGSGYWFGIGNETPVKETGGNKATLGDFFKWLSPQAAAGNKAQTFYEPSPGVFQPLAGAKVAAGTPNFIRA